MAKRVNYRDHVVDGELDLSMTDLQEVPVRDIALTKKATSLDLSNNRLVSLGKNFATLAHLIKLDLSKNQISALPSNFGDLVLLKHLDLYCNNISSLPLSFGKLQNLKWLDLKNNPLNPALQDIAGPCLNAQQCQTCAKKVVKVLADTQKRLDDEKERQLKEQKEREMAEKAAAKKEQQKNKKVNKNEKKKGPENGTKQEQPQKQQQHKKKEKSRQANRAVAKKSGSLLGRFFKWIFVITLLISLVLTVLYYLDVEKFREVQAYAQRTLNTACDQLPPQYSTFLKAHGANLRDILVFLGGRIFELASTVIAVTPGYINDLTKKLSASKNNT